MRVVVDQRGSSLLCAEVGIVHAPASPAPPRQPARFRSCNTLISPPSVRLRYDVGLHDPRQGVACRASPSAVGAASTQWWLDKKELWCEAHTEEEFWALIDGGDQQIVFVDFFATWCDGCKSVYPAMCQLAAQQEWKGKVRFVKLCVDELKQFSKDVGVKALPYCALYRTGQREPLAGFQAVPSRAAALKKNLAAVVDSDARWFKVDPNGFVIPSETPPNDPATKARRAVELAKLRLASLNTSKHLAAIEPSLQQARPAAAPAAVPAGAALPAGISSVERVGAANGAGSSGAGGAAGAAAAVQWGGDTLAGEKAAFLRVQQDSYGYGGRIDALYEAEVGDRLPAGHHYLDYTGSSLYTNSALRAAFDELRGAVFGNPHSDNPSSQLSTSSIEEVRNTVRRFFNAPATDYSVVFTQSATGSLKLVGETFPWSAGSEFRYLRVNHNSVLGVRQYALQHGARFTAVEEEWVDDWIAGRVADPAPAQPQGQPQPAAAVPAAVGGSGAEAGGKTYSLFAFPAEDNFAGVKYPLDWVAAVQAKSSGGHEWKVLLDAAAYVPTQPLDLTATPADFVSISFYKMFGYPTGLGALLVRNDSCALLNKVFFGGGSVSLAAASDPFFVLKCEPAERLEDGTVAFLDIPALKHGFAMIQSLGGIHRVQAHVGALTRWMYGRLSGMRHSNGAPMTVVFGKHGRPDSANVQGGILNFELLRPDGIPYSYRTFQLESAAAGFHIRTGSECNPGACYKYVGVADAEVESLAGVKEACDDDVEWITVERPAEERRAVTSGLVAKMLQGSRLPLGHAGEIAMKWVQKPLGTIRCSLGYMSRFEDCHAFAAWIEAVYKDREE